ncbi:MAG: flavin-containing monooxygenase, partial [Acidimicrobiales bacterium]
FWRSHEGLLPRLEVDPEWPEPHEVSISQSNDELRQLLTLYLEGQFADRPDLLEKVQPRYTMGAKRFVVDNGIWAQTLKRDDVELVTNDIEAVSPQGVITADETQRELDVLILATGFDASSFLTPMKVIGRGGSELHDVWAGDARAYLGVVSPGFPNLFYMYGPNTNIVINGSIIYFSECEARYITDCIRHLLEDGSAAIDVRPEVHDRYNTWIDEGNEKMAWGVSSVSSWYKTNGGRVAQNWPYSLLEYWEQTQVINPADYHHLR